MSNFTEEIKSEIMDSGFREDMCPIALSALIRTCGSIISSNGWYGFELVSENEETIQYFYYYLQSRKFPLSFINKELDNFSKRIKYSFSCVGAESTDYLIKMGILSQDNDGVSLRFGIDFNLLGTIVAAESYIKGAFLGGGSCTIPDENTTTGYHLEFTFSNKILAEDFGGLLCDLEILPKMVSRKDSYVVYVKSKEVISDILYILVQGPCFEKFRSVVKMRENENNANRAVNCSVSNLDKALTASVKQIQAIETIKQLKGLKTLSEPLFSVAMCRLADPNASMQELADRMGISKSCINHRMRKIFDIASTLSQD